MLKDVSGYIEHTVLSPEVTKEDIRLTCQQAMDNHFAAIVIRGCWVPLAKELLTGTGVHICSSAGATTGMNLPHVKALEAAELVKAGCDEIDTYINMSFVKSGMWQEAFDDIFKVVKSVKEINAAIPVKVIVENGLLYQEDKKKVYLLCKETGADYVKTNSGFVPGVANAADIRLIRETVGPDMGIKAASHIYDYKTALEMIEAGATRIGTTSAMKIMAQQAKMLAT